MEIEALSGVGGRTAPHLRELGVKTAEELLEYFPFRYDDLRAITPAAQLAAAEGDVNAVGTIVTVRERRARSLEIVEARLEDESGSFGAKWIGRRRYVLGRFHKGMRLFVRGRVERSLAEPTISVATYARLDDGETYQGRLEPVYHASKDLSSRKIAQIVRKNLPRLLDLAGEDPLPPKISRARKYPALRKAFQIVHEPDTLEGAALARERFIFTEFLAVATEAQLRRAEREHEHGARPLQLAPALLDEFEAALGFSLTGAQRRVIAEIWNDMASDVPMNRLLQGDVGSGKTAAAAAAVILAARNGVQSALMAPTEVLAAQHAAKLAPLLLPFGIAVEAVLGSQRARSRAAAIDRLSGGEAALAVGTHALLTEGVDFARLGLVIIDEQHRFGVEQRARLRAKGGTPHTLHMTATPIPRTLAQSVYADLDVSTIDELPPGRTPIETFAIRKSRIAEVHEFVRKNVALGHQAYIVAPAIEESDSDIASAVAEFERLRKNVFADLRVGLLHGKLTPRQKDDVMGRSTTVVEVGVDVANAGVMVVLDAQRYGLAQLHQLRGRVGRGAAKSYCLLVAPDDAGQIDRLEVLTKSTDGFYIAERDLQLRGPGEFAGTRQSGMPEFRVGDLVRDIHIYEAAKVQAEAIVRHDFALSRPEHARLRALIEAEPSRRDMLLSS
jgi:ATP-dependent DNA helicase RecG